MQNSSEQWKSGGDCGQCRREKYCGTECRAHRVYVKAMQDEAFAKVMAQFMKENAKLKEEAEGTAEQEESIPAKEAEN